MPETISLPLIRPNRRFTHSEASPHHWPRMAVTVVGCAMIAGVQSTVWIFAISALFTIRARS